MFETLLLLVTCVWIIYESIQRLFIKSVEVDPSIWAFIVMAVSIIIDYSRSRVLYRAARKHNSQALEADALHFSTDIWSSSVVIVGLVGVWLSSELPGAAWLTKADAVAALGVAVIVIYVSMQLGSRTIQGLLDHAPRGLAEQIQQPVEEIAGVENCHQVRVRTSGAELFIDAHINVNPDLTLHDAHALTEVVEHAIAKVAPNADITIHPEPIEMTETPQQV